MNIGENNRLVVDTDDGLTFQFVKSPNTLPGSLAHKFLVIHATEGPDVRAAINTFLSVSGGTSAHLILSRDGREVVQMVDFNQRAQHAHEFNSRAIGIELDYTGHLRDDQAAINHFSHISKFRPGEYIYAVALNDRGDIPLRMRPWPRYTREQMDALVPIARLFVEKFGLQIVGHEEIKSFKLDPGPAFPMTRFKEIVLQKSEGSVLFDELAQDLELRTGPGVIYPLLSGGQVPAGTPVSTIDDQDGWALVEVMADVGGNRWLVGWTPLNTIVARQASPVVKDHKLFTTDGRQYQFIAPHPNNYAADKKLTEPKYLIIHITDGIVMESTINSFRDEKHGASAHLLIGRDGRVVQFVDFDTVAFHCGFSYWEEDEELNFLSIGIEVDNGATLTRADGVWKWKTTIIPEEDVEEIRYWKHNSKRGWHKFTDVQIKVLREIIQALQQKYGMKLLLGHDVINLAEREDPGPLFPMVDFQELVSGEPGVTVKVYRTKTDANIYKNPNQEPPDLSHPKHPGILPARTKINVLIVKGDWTRVKVKGEAGPLRGTEGWVRSGAVDSTPNKQKTTQDSEYFKINPSAPSKPPWTFLRQNPVPADTRLRVEKFEGAFALIATLEPVREKYLEGWVERRDIELVGEERIIYPPISRRRR